jgi:hypothetical protein
VQSLSERQGSVLDDVRKKVTGLEEQLAHMEPAMKEVLRRAARSAYLVLVSRDDGTEAGAGTAFVVAPGVLATNAHDAELHGKLLPGHRVVCRSSDSPPKDHVVQSVEMHPGFAEFQRIWEEYGPARRRLGERHETLQAVAACDVALLRVEDPDALLAPALPLAAKEDLARLSSPDTVGFAGYPAEGMAVGGVNVRQPEPTVQVGHVTAVTDFFLAKDVSGEGRLLQHSLPVTGGASGSPMLDAGGRVVGVICAANFAFTQDGARLPIAVGVNFAQRADLVQELLDGRAAETQAPRTREWEEGIKQFVSGTAIARQAFAEARPRQLERLLQEWGQSGNLVPRKVSEESGALSAADPQGRHVARFQLRGLPGKARALIALPATETDIDMYVFRGGTEDLLGADEQRDWFPARALPADAPTDLDVTVVGPREGLAVTLYVYEAE